MSLRRAWGQNPRRPARFAATAPLGLPVCFSPCTDVCSAGLRALPLFFGSASFNIHIDYSYIKGAQKYQSRTKAIIIMQP